MEFVLQETKWMSDEERFNSPRLEMQLQEHVAKAELLLEEMELIRALEKVESPMSETQLKEHVMKAGLQPSEMEMGCGKCRLSNVGNANERTYT